MLTVSATFAQVSINGGPPASLSFINNWGDVITVACGSVEQFTHADPNATMAVYKWDEQSPRMSTLVVQTPAPGQSILIEAYTYNWNKTGHLGDDITLTRLPGDTADFIDWHLYGKPINESEFTELNWKAPITLSGANAQQGYNSWALAFVATNTLQPVPEPSSMLALTSFIGLGGFVLRRRK